MTKLGIIQTAQYASNRQAVQDVSESLRSLGAKGTDIVCLPEQWLAENTIDCWDDAFAPFMEIASEFSMCVVPGAFYHGGDRCRRHHHCRETRSGTCGTDGDGDGVPQSIAAPVISADGEIAGVQEKIHPFEYENNTVAPGREARIFESDGTRFGIMICHDVVFPAVAGMLAKKGAQVILAPSRIVRRGTDPWRTYIEARTLENRIPVMAANVTGGRFGGCSIITGLRVDDGVATIDGIPMHDDHVTRHSSREVDLERYDTLRERRLSEARPFA